jgi:dTDP-4-amino-4,6-dideoxygalactose transaminase
MPEMDEREASAARRAILSGWTTMGPEVAAFEAEFAGAVGARHACAVSSGTAALHLALMAVGVDAGSEVITVSHSFIATANAVRYCGGTPVFVDIDPQTYNIDPALVEAAITPKTRAILCVHQLGMPCDLAALTLIAHRHGLPLIEDAACAVGSEILWQGQWERIGQVHGDMVCFSFHPRKILSTGDGGMITAGSDALDQQLRQMRNQGMNVSADVRHASDRVIFESYDTLGYNYRMTDIQGAIGREQLKRLGGIVKRRRAVAARYTEMLGNLHGVHLPREPEWARSNWQSYCVQLAKGIDRQHVMQRLLDDGVATKPGVMCAHREPAYARESWRCEASGLRHSEEAQARGLMLPLYQQMTDEELETVVALLLSAIC